MMYNFLFMSQKDRFFKTFLEIIFVLKGRFFDSFEKKIIHHMVT
jgi:hypothetical protein